jgi:hypothetical protein
MVIILSGHFTSEDVSSVWSAVTIYWVAMSYNQVENTEYNILEIAREHIGG